METMNPLPEEFIPVHSLMPPLNVDEVLKNVDHQPVVAKAYSKLFVKLHSSRTEKSSAYMEMNGTKVMVKILPPRDIPATDSSRINLAEIDVVIRYLEPGERTYKHERNESMLHREVRHVLENIICRAVYTNMIFEVSVVVVDDNGCALSLIINSCILALIKGGISIFDLVTSSTVCFYGGVLIDNPTGNIADLIDRASSEVGNEHFGIMTCSQLSGISNMPQVVCSGCFTPDHFKIMMSRCQELNGVLKTKFQKLIRKSVITSQIEWESEERQRRKIRKRVLKIAEARQRKITEQP